MNEYVSIAEEFQIEYIVEKSRFIATAAPCKTEEEAQAFITAVSKRYWDATHNCTAYCLGENQEKQRSSDNGEPSGTAGKPMLEVLKKTGITDTVIVVTRYFGGIKLGAGGLIRAYSHSAATVLKEAPKILFAPRLTLIITIDYSFYNSLEIALREKQYLCSADFAEQVRLTVLVPPEEATTLTAELENMTNGTVHIDKGSTTIQRLPLA